MGEEMDKGKKIPLTRVLSKTEKHQLSFISYKGMTFFPKGEKGP